MVGGNAMTIYNEHKCKRRFCKNQTDNRLYCSTKCRVIDFKKNKIGIFSTESLKKLSKQIKKIKAAVFLIKNFKVEEEKLEEKRLQSI